MANTAEFKKWLLILDGNGEFVHQETAAPTGSDGANGEWWWDSTTNILHGPKTGGAWSRSVSLTDLAFGKHKEINRLSSA